MEYTSSVVVSASKTDNLKTTVFKFDMDNQQRPDSLKSPSNPKSWLSASWASLKSTSRNKSPAPTINYPEKGVDHLESPISPVSVTKGSKFLSQLSDKNRRRAWTMDSKRTRPPQLSKLKLEVRTFGSDGNLSKHPKIRMRCKYKEKLPLDKEISCFSRDPFHRSVRSNVEYRRRSDDSMVCFNRGLNRRKSSDEQIQHGMGRPSSRNFFCFKKQDEEAELDEQGTTQPIIRDSSFEYFTSSLISISEGGMPFVENLKNGIHIGGLSSMFDMNKAPSDLGSIKIRFQYFNKTGRFHVSLIKGANIGNGTDGELNMYVKVTLMPGKLQQMRGDGFHDTTNPVFYESFNFRRIKLDDLLDKTLRVKFYNKRGLFVHTLLGEAVVPLFNYDLTAETVTWRHLKRCSGQKVSILGENL